MTEFIGLKIGTSGGLMKTLNESSKRQIMWKKF